MSDELIVQNNDNLLEEEQNEVVDTELGVEGQEFYEVKEENWGTNLDDKALIEKEKMLESATWSLDYQDTMETLCEKHQAALTRLINVRYRKTASQLENYKKSPNDDDKRRLGKQIYMDLCLIQSCIENHVDAHLFAPTLSINTPVHTDIYGVLAKYQADLDGTSIPLINGKTDQNVTDRDGNNITALQGIEDLLGHNISIQDQIGSNLTM